jgi:hypothetical protein
MTNIRVAAGSRAGGVSHWNSAKTGGAVAGRAETEKVDVSPQMDFGGHYMIIKWLIAWFII